MSEERLSFEEYSKLMNRIAGWLVREECEFNKRNVYGAIGRDDTDLGTVEQVALDRYNNGEFQADTIINEYTECAIVDNLGDLGFMPTYVRSEAGVDYDRNTYVSMALRTSKFEVENGQEPNYVRVIWGDDSWLPEDDPEPSPEPEPEEEECSSPYTQRDIHTTQGGGLLGQKTGYYCGPHSVMQCIYDLTNIDLDEHTLASVGGTTSSGTGHSGLNTMIEWFNRNYEPTLEINWYNFSDLGWDKVDCLMDREDTALFFHLLYRNQWGHYELPYQDTDGESSLKIANSLGSQGSGGYYGYIETRSFSAQESYISGISQKSVCVIKRVD